ncbi:hypothetical protein BH23ACT11_BH23ACT11_22100 [soil metagenome]
MLESLINEIILPAGVRMRLALTTSFISSCRSYESARHPLISHPRNAMSMESNVASWTTVELHSVPLPSFYIRFRLQVTKHAACDFNGAVVASVNVPDDAHARAAGKDAFELLRDELGAVGNADLAGVD